ncbi:elongator complex protein 4 isoform X2 [Oryzias melastigma]|uniref:elongator complex protein 4 isoform X2 n=1 Tax=Oryzias melastigma TaxID=30732 RepID=UPI00168D6B30|nr:elongator complex protein 4 isoform X2 [Oryzias melastigma]
MNLRHYVTTNMAAPMSSVDKTPAECLQLNSTSFQKKTRSKFISIPGTRPSVQNGQLLVSSGVTSLDYLLGGGLAVGTVLLIEEDRYDSFSRMIFKYFLAEGVVCRHELFVAAAQDDPDDILQELPAPILDDVAIHRPGDQPRMSCEPQDTLDAMKIAWRYQNLPKVQSALASSSRFGHYYDVSKIMEPEIRQAAKWHRFYHPEHPPPSSGTHSPKLESYSALLKSLQEVIQREGFDLNAPLDRALMGSITRLCDNAIALESFKGSERETNPLYKDYHGLLHVRQVPRLNCLASQLPDHKDLAFKLKRKQFTIERLHLPPDLSETVSRVGKGEPAAAACASATSSAKHLDF